MFVFVVQPYFMYSCVMIFTYFSRPELYVQYCPYPVHTLLVIQVLLSIIMLGTWVGCTDSYHIITPFCSSMSLRIQLTSL